MFLTPLNDKRDATSPTPRTARAVKLGSFSYSREGLETAWLLLQDQPQPLTEVGMSAALRAMEAAGWGHVQAAEIIQAASGWTGEIMHGCANCPCD